MADALVIRGLKKTYRNNPVEVLHGVDLRVPQGQFFGLLGPNGAGKTTTINCITGVTEYTSGSISVFGADVVHDYRTARAHIGVSPQEFTVDMFQTPDEILDFHGGFFGMERAGREARREKLLTDFGLLPHRSKKFVALSGGLKRRVTLAKSLMHSPDLLILDEPTAGVDVETRRMLWDYLRELHAEGKTIIFTSHYLEEVEQLCERVAIIQHGRLVVDEMMGDFTKDGTLEKAYLAAVAETTQSV